MLFPPDITHLRFTRSHELKADEQRRQREHAACIDEPAAYYAPEIRRPQAEHANA